jgi:hypothetical protein
MSDFFHNYLKYKSKYLKLKEIMYGGAPPKVSNASGLPDVELSKALSIVEDEFMRRDAALQHQLIEATSLINSLREQIASNREDMLRELSKLRSVVVIAPSVEESGSSLSAESGSSVSLVASVPKRTVSKQQSASLSKDLNDILTNASIELEEKISRLNRVYSANKDICDASDDKGLVTVLSRYAYLKKDDVLMDSLFDRFSMTRDYLVWMAYYHDKIPQNIQLFKEKVNLDNFEQKNIEFIIENNIIYLLPLLEGRFIKLDTKEKLIPGSSISGLRQLYIPNPQYYIDKICDYTSEIGTGRDKDKLFTIECSASQKKDRRKLQTILESDNDYDVIIDGGNLMHVGGGKNVQNIVVAFKELTKLGFRPLVILYHKHTRDSSIVGELNRNRIKFIGTPGSNDDDIFTLLAFLNNSKKNKSCYILTNDKYKKWFAIYKHTEQGQEKHFEGFVNDTLLEYNIAPNGSITISTPILPYSQCIQVVDSNVCLPTKTHGMFNVIPI